MTCTCMSAWKTVGCTQSYKTVEVILFEWTEIQLQKVKFNFNLVIQSLKSSGSITLQCTCVIVSVYLYINTWQYTNNNSLTIQAIIYYRMCRTYITFWNLKRKTESLPGNCFQKGTYTIFIQLLKKLMWIVFTSIFECIYGCTLDHFR